ncbi:hypothetical protein IAT40_004930 [Kwoniella sp. CBS 6097]
MNAEPRSLDDTTEILVAASRLSKAGVTPEWIDKALMEGYQRMEGGTANSTARRSEGAMQSFGTETPTLRTAPDTKLSIRVSGLKTMGLSQNAIEKLRREEANDRGAASNISASSVNPTSTVPTSVGGDTSKQSPSSALTNTKAPGGTPTTLDGNSGDIWGASNGDDDGWDFEEIDPDFVEFQQSSENDTRRWFR